MKLGSLFDGSGRVDVAPGPDSIRPEKWAENETEVVK